MKSLSSHALPFVAVWVVMVTIGTAPACRLFTFVRTSMRTSDSSEPGLVHASSPASAARVTAWRVSPDVRADPDAEATVLLDLRRGQCHALNPLGTCIWRLLSGAAGGLTEAGLAAALRPLVANPPSHLESDVRAFLVTLSRKGLVLPTAPGGGESAHAADAAAATFAVPPVLRRVRRASLQFVAAFSLLLASDLVMRLAGVRGLRALVSRVSLREQAAEADSVESAKALALVVHRAAAYYYKHAWCLHRAVATSCFLRLNGIASTVCIGFHPMPFYGHAWVEVHDTVVDDRIAVRTRYRVLERF